MGNAHYRWDLLPTIFDPNVTATRAWFTCLPSSEMPKPFPCQRLSRRVSPLLKTPITLMARRGFFFETSSMEKVCT